LGLLLLEPIMVKRLNPALPVLTAALLLALTACSQPAAEGAGTPDAPVASGADPGAAKGAGAPVSAEARDAVAGPVYAEGKGGIALRAVAGTRVAHDFQRDYLASPSWKLFAPPESVGTPLVALVLDGSDRVTAAELRIGRSDDAAAVSECLATPAEATGPAAPATVDIGGVPFTHFSVGDAAMSHYVNAESYRALHSGACYAIDLVVAGTRPEVYDPPRTPPFSQQDAASRLAEALKAVYWLP